MAKKRRVMDSDEGVDPAELRAAVYVRQSQTSLNSVSIDFQNDELVREAAHRRWQFEPDADIYIDQNLSGSKEEVVRPAFDRLMTAVGEGRYQRILVWKLDRFSRRPAELHTSLEFMGKHGCHLVSLNDSIDSSTTSGRLIISVAAAVASIEVENTRTRVISTQRNLTDRGRWAGGPAPYGWRLINDADGTGTRLEVIPAQAKVIQLAARLIVEEGHGIGSAAKWLNANEHLAGRERPWSPQALGTTLRRRALVGHHERGGRIALDLATGRPAISHAAILDVGVFTALQERIAELGKHKTKEAGGGALLAGLLRCGRCGGLLHGCDSERTPKGNYRCRLRYDLNGDCEGVSILAKLVERVVAEKVIARLGAGGNIPLTEDQWLAGRVAAIDSQIEQRQRFVRAEMKRLLDERFEGIWSYPGGADAWADFYQRFVEETNELAQQASDAVAASARPAPVPYYPWKDADEVLRTWRKLEQQDRRRTIRQLLTGAVVHPVGSEERVTIDWRTDVSHRP